MLASSTRYGRAGLSLGKRGRKDDEDDKRKKKKTPKMTPASKPLGIVGEPGCKFCNSKSLRRSYKARIGVEPYIKYPICPDHLLMFAYINPRHNHFVWVPGFGRVEHPFVALANDLHLANVSVVQSGPGTSDNPVVIPDSSDPAESDGVIDLEELDAEEVVDTALQNAVGNIAAPDGQQANPWDQPWSPDEVEELEELKAWLLDMRDRFPDLPHLAQQASPADEDAAEEVDELAEDVDEDVAELTPTELEAGSQSDSSM